MVAYNDLTEEEKDLIPTSPKDSTVEMVTINEEIKDFIDCNYDKNQVYQVVFHHTAPGSSGSLVVFIALDKKTVVGESFIE